MRIPTENNMNDKAQAPISRGTERANQILAELESCSAKELRMRLQRLANKLLT